MISEDNDRVRGAEKEMVPVGDGANYDKEFLVIDLIISFSRAKGF